MANGLINLQTDLKSLRYGNDKPYITKNIGQAPGSQIGMEVQHRIDDTSRIAQMLVDKPGINYILNEALLNQASSDRSIAKARKDGKSIVGAVLKQVKYTAQLLGSTLAQVPVNGTGLHFLKGFRTDTYLQPKNQNNISAFASFFGAGGVEGAPYALRGETVPGTHETNLLDSYRSIDILPNHGNDGKQKYTSGSTYTGIKTEDTLGYTLTNIPIPVGDYTDSYIPGLITPPVNEDITKGTTSIPAPQSLRSLREDLNNTGTEKQSTNTVSEDSYVRQVQDFRQGSTSTYSFDYSNTKIKRETRVQLGDQGAKKPQGFYNKYSTTGSAYIDKINALDVYQGTLKKELDEYGVSKTRDLVKFYFELITPDTNTFLHFRAFLDNIDDGYTADWQAHKYVGRAENFYTYAGFDRDITVSFKIAAATRSEMKPLYKKMVYLASSTAPTYGGSSSKFMRGTVAKMTIGSYFAQIPGVITSVKYNLVDGTPWEIAMQNPEAGTDDDVQELPMVLQCSVSFKPIHDFAPQTGLYHYFTSPNENEGSKVFFTQGDSA